MNPFQSDFYMLSLSLRSPDGRTQTLGMEITRQALVNAYQEALIAEKAVALARKLEGATKLEAGAVYPAEPVWEVWKEKAVYPTGKPDIYASWRH